MRLKARRKFLPEIQALRALAVLMVVAYHLEPRWLPGGFVGVDVFFVISGFLITGHMLREVERTGTLSLRNFWAARVRRILPAALLTIVVVLAATLLLAPMTQWAQVGTQALASTFYLQNWVLAADSVDYLAAADSATALQHFWSLAWRSSSICSGRCWSCWPSPSSASGAAPSGPPHGTPDLRRHGSPSCFLPW